MMATTAEAQLNEKENCIRVKAAWQQRCTHPFQGNFMQVNAQSSAAEAMKA